MPTTFIVQFMNKKVLDILTNNYFWPASVYIVFIQWLLLRTASGMLNRQKSVEMEELQSYYEQKFIVFQNEMYRKEELSTNLKNKHLESINCNLETKCWQYENHCHQLQQERLSWSMKTYEMEAKCYKYELEKEKLNNEHFKLNNEKKEIEKDLLRSHNMLSDSYRYVLLLLFVFFVFLFFYYLVR